MGNSKIAQIYYMIFLISYFEAFRRNILLSTQLHITEEWNSMNNTDFRYPSVQKFSHFTNFCIVVNLVMDIKKGRSVSFLF